MAGRKLGLCRQVVVWAILCRTKWRDTPEERELPKTTPLKLTLFATFQCSFRAAGVLVVSKNVIKVKRSALPRNAIISLFRRAAFAA